MPRLVVPLRHVVKPVRWASTVPKPARPPTGRLAQARPPDKSTSEVHAPRSPSAAAGFARGQRLPWLLASCVAAGIGFYCLQLYLAARKPCAKRCVAELSQQKDVVERYDTTAEGFDSEVGMSELLMGINSMRKKLAKKCHGHVLEVSCGTGRNLGYYDITGKDAQVDSLTFIDISPQMVDMCKKKWDALYGSQRKRKALNQNLRVRFMTGSAIDAMPLAPSGRRYETIIQTMGLCSTPSPLPLLTNMVKHLDTSNPDSRILLLEHGRSYMPWMNNILDNSAEKHAEIHGCWFNREIGDLVEAAAEQTGLEVVSERRHHFGTTWIFELKPKDETVKAARAETGEAQSADEVEDKKLGWLNWLKAPSE